MFINQFNLDNDSNDSLSAYKVIISSESSSTHSLLATILPCIISDLRQSKSLSDIPDIAKLNDIKDYTLKITDGSLCFLCGGQISQFVTEVSNIIYDDTLMTEKKNARPLKDKEKGRIYSSISSQ